MKDLDDRKANKPTPVPKLPDTVLTGEWVCVENDDGCALYFGASDRWLKMTIEDS